MKVTYNWLSDFIDISDLSAYDVADILTSVGIEVNSVKYAGENLENIVTGKIISLSKHPNADKLTICQVNVGDRTVQVITHATNIFKGAIVPVALHGSRIKSGKRIKRSKLRGIESDGMLCSEEELGLASASTGIMILPNGTKIGLDIKDVLKLNDYIIDYEITINRPDALSILGIVRELKAYLNRNYKLPDVTFMESSEDIKDTASLSVENSACLRYDGYVAKDISNLETPLWMKVRLHLVGLRSINAVVDITNYVMCELGQPLHAFDLDKIKDKTVIVRAARNGESILTLDGIERKLTDDDLIISDTEKPIAIAGIMGGQNSAVSESTRSIFLESAHFEPLTVRRTSKKLDLSTDASYRFERGADIEATDFCARRALHLMQKICNASMARGKLEYYPKPYIPKIIAFNPEKAKRVLGINIPMGKSFEILSALGFKTKKEQGYIVTSVPSWRKYDVSRDVDLFEEIVRIYGMKNVESTYPLMHSDVEKNFNYLKVQEIKNLLSDTGLFESINYSFISKKLYENFGLKTDKLIRIANPISELWEFMRDAIFPSLVNNVVSNIRNNEENVGIFEVSKVFNGNTEPLHIATAMSGKVPTGSFGVKDVDFFDLKGIVEKLLKFLRLRADFSPSKLNFLHPFQSANVVINGKILGFIGKLHPNVIENLDAKQDIFISELNLDELLELSKATSTQFKPISKFPPVTRDIAVICDEDVPVSEVQRVIASSAKKLESIEVFDIYSGKNIPEGKKSIGFSLTFRSDRETLSDEKVDRITCGIIKSLEEHGFKLRA